MERVFEWDDRKADANFRKHGVRFEEAALAFDDPFAVSEQDRIKSGEERWQTLGMVGDYLLLLVAHTISFEEDGFETVRIISARHADRKERSRYGNH